MFWDLMLTKIVPDVVQPLLREAQNDQLHPHLFIVHCDDVVVHNSDSRQTSADQIDQQ